MYGHVNNYVRRWHNECKLDEFWKSWSGWSRAIQIAESAHRTGIQTVYAVHQIRLYN